MALLGGWFHYQAGFPMQTQDDKLVFLHQALGVLSAYSSRYFWYFRGQANINWPLVPKAGRRPYYRSSHPVDTKKETSLENPTPDLALFNRWRRDAVAYAQVPDNDFYALACAQHHGLPTRLLDLTSNVLVALYFACESEFQVDGALYAYLPEMYVNTDRACMGGLKMRACLQMPPLHPRVLAQKAAFLYFVDPAVPLEPELLREEHRPLHPTADNLVKFRIPADCKTIMLNQLADVGVTRRLLFPDLDGLSSELVLEATIKDFIKNRASRLDDEQNN